MPDKPRATLISLKGNAAWSAWLRGLSDHTCLPATNLVDMALKEYAAKVGYPEPMPMRQRGWRKEARRAG